MDIVIVRHALAMEREEFAEKGERDDSLRPLVLKGRKRMVKVAKDLKRFVPKVELIVTSPFVRAKETAAILMKNYPGTKLVEAAELVPSAPPEAFLNWLHSQRAKLQTIIVVGHEPQLSLFASFCLAGQQETFIDLKKSGALCISIDSLAHLQADTANLKWLITPKILESN